MGERLIRYIRYQIRCQGTKSAAAGHQRQARPLV